MSSIQIILLAAILSIIVRIMVQYHKKKLDTRTFVWWISFFILGAFVITIPDIVNRIADAVGVSRGADVVVYVSLIFVFFLILKLYQRIISIDKDIVKIVRALSRTNANNDESKKT